MKSYLILIRSCFCPSPISYYFPLGFGPPMDPVPPNPYQPEPRDPSGWLRPESLLWYALRSILDLGRKLILLLWIVAPTRPCNPNPTPNLSQCPT